MAETPKPASILEVFYSYAGEDEALRNVLEKHLSMIQHQGFIASWSYRKISAGAELASEVNAHLNRAQIILLLVSADFLSSDYCYGVEMQRAMERHNAGEARVIPILLRPVDYAGAPFNKLEVLPANGKAISLWRDRDEAFTNVAKGIRKAVEAFNSLTQSAHLPSQSLSFTAVGEGPGRIWNVPFRRNPFFTGREDILIHLYKQFHQGKSEALIQAQALTGLGGIGKTQIAVEYAYRYQQDYRAVLWVKADSHEALNSGFLTIADVLQLPEKNARDQRLIVAAVKRWLEQSNDWLLILDNADEVAMVQDFLPTTNKGHILLTTRARWLGTIAQGVELNIMEQEEGALLLLRRAHILPADVTLSRASATDRSQSSQLVAELGGLPLALDHAGAYIEETSTDLSHYLDLYHTRRQVLLNRRSKMPNNHPEPVAATWALAFRRVEQDNPAASELLRICAFLHPDSIPVELIASGASDLGTVLESVAHDPWQLDESIGELQRFSLVRRHADTNTLSIHRLVQAVLKDEMDAQMQQQWAERAVRVVNRGFPFVEMSTWPQCQRYLPHALVCADSIERFDIASAEAARLLHQTGNYLMERAQYPEAEPLYKRALAIKEKVVGPAHPSTAMTLNNLANLYTNQGKYEQAEPLLQRALAIYEKVLGTDHPDTAGTINNLANFYMKRGKYEQAELFLQRALKIYEQALPQHPDTVLTYNNLANLYMKQGKYEQAESLLQRAQVISERTMPDHLATAITFDNLANLFTHQGQYEKASTFRGRARYIRQMVLGSDHLPAARVLKNYLHLLPQMELFEFGLY